MESNLFRSHVNISGNLSSKCTILISDIFNLFPGSFQKIIPHLESRYRIVVYTDTGFDASHPRQGLRHFSMQEYANDMIECLTEYNLGTITYLSHSVNTLLAFTAGAKAPDLFDKMILINAFPSLCADPQTRYSCGFAARNVADLFTALMQKQYDACGEENNDSIIQLTDILATAFSKMNIETAQAIFHLLIHTDCRKSLSSFDIPTLILQSAADKFSTAETSFFMHRIIPNSRIIKIRAKGHLPQVNAPEEIIRAMEFFTYSPVCL